MLKKAVLPPVYKGQRIEIEISRNGIRRDLTGIWYRNRRKAAIWVGSMETKLTRGQLRDLARWALRVTS